MLCWLEFVGFNLLYIKLFWSQTKSNLLFENKNKNKRAKIEIKKKWEPFFKIKIGVGAFLLVLTFAL